MAAADQIYWAFIDILKKTCKFCDLKNDLSAVFAVFWLFSSQYFDDNYPHN